MQTQLKSKEGN